MLEPYFVCVYLSTITSSLGGVRSASSRLSKRPVKNDSLCTNWLTTVSCGYWLLYHKKRLDVNIPPSGKTTELRGIVYHSSCNLRNVTAFASLKILLYGPDRHPYHQVAGFNCFHRFRESVNGECFWSSLRGMNTSEKLITIIRAIYDVAKCHRLHRS